MRARATAGIVDENIDAAELCHHGIAHARAARLRGEIPHDDDCRATGVPDARGDGLAALTVAAVYHYRRRLGGKDSCDAGPDPGTAAGDEGALSAQL